MYVNTPCAISRGYWLLNMGRFCYIAATTYSNANAILVCLLVGLFVIWLISWLFVRLVGLLFSRSVGRPIGWLLDSWLVDWIWL